MREIKFRVWDPIYKDMDYDPFGIWSSYCLGDGKLRTIGGPAGQEWTDPTDDSLMQYSGCKDINDVCIYEGDIVKTPECYGGDNFYESDIGVVVFEEECFLVDKTSNLGFYNLDQVEVIGNIYQNKKELI